MYVAQLTMQWKYRNESYNAIYIAHLIPKNIFITVSLFSVMALYAERFLAIQLHLRYQELVMYRRVVIAVISIWVFSTLTSLLKLWIPKNIMFVFFVIKDFSSTLILGIVSRYCNAKNRTSLAFQYQRINIESSQEIANLIKNAILTLFFQDFMTKINTAMH